MKGFFESINKLGDQREAVEKLDGFEGMLETKEVKRCKEEIRERVLNTIKLNFYKISNEKWTVKK